MRLELRKVTVPGGTSPRCWIRLHRDYTICRRRMFPFAPTAQRLAGPSCFGEVCLALGFVLVILHVFDPSGGVLLGLFRVHVTTEYRPGVWELLGCSAQVVV